MQCDEDLHEKEVQTARISRRAAAGFRSFCAAHGITVTGFLEVAGRELAAESPEVRVEMRREMIEMARRVDLERRSRKR